MSEGSGSGRHTPLLSDSSGRTHLLTEGSNWQERSYVFVLEARPRLDTVRRLTRMNLN